MYAIITLLELKSPWLFFKLSYLAMHIVLQLRKDKNCLAQKNTGFWTTHYTMTLWNSEAAMKAFARSGAHLEAMKQSGKLAKEIRILTIPAAKLPSWKEAKLRVYKEGKVYHF